ncbi:MAG: hypothetical protein LBT52_01110 [Clostridiales Family XIII bacterium]|jgi:diacylglycerol kinase family enzyme|nr:hypothetical protein [Clostridiales Family XIII bacterium]
MKHIFLLNPVAGKGQASTDVLPGIISAVKAKGVEYEIHRTVNVGDARRYVNNRCEDSGGAPVRFYAVGGDGTMNEVLNGLYGYGNAELAVVPAGTGNDLLRTFGVKEDFLDIERQIDGRAGKIDAIRYEFLDESEQAVAASGDKPAAAAASDENPVVAAPDNKPAAAAASDENPVVAAPDNKFAVAAPGDNPAAVASCGNPAATAPGDKPAAAAGYALNMLNFGFDAEVVSRTTRIKNAPFMGGTVAYIGGVLSTLIGKRPLQLTIEADGLPVAEGAYLFAGACNGRYSGGGFEGMPRAVIGDGILDVLIIGDMTRRRFLSLLGKYRAGTYMDDPRMDGYAWHYPVKEAVFRPQGEMYTAIDGEPIRTGAVRVSIEPAAINFSVPAGLRNP